MKNQKRSKRHTCGDQEDNDSRSAEEVPAVEKVGATPLLGDLVIVARSCEVFDVFHGFCCVGLLRLRATVGAMCSGPGEAVDASGWLDLRLGHDHTVGTSGD